MFPPAHSRIAHYLLLLSLAILLFLTNLGKPSLWDVDEGHNAEAAREMLEANNWIVPTFNFHLRTDKPALLYWLQMVAYRAFGINEFAARLPSAMAAMLCMLICYELGGKLFNSTTGLLSGVILISTIMFSAAAHFANPDALLCAFSTSTLFCFWKSFSENKRSWFILASFSAAFGVMAKGPVGLVMPLAVSIIFLIWNRRFGFLLDRKLCLGTCAFVLIALPWYIMVGVETRTEFLREFFFKHNVGRFQGAMEGHAGALYYYLEWLIIGFAPWSIFIIPACWYACPEVLGSSPRSFHKKSDGLVTISLPYRFLFCWIIVFFAFFSLSATKLPNYILPLYPALAILVARLLDRWCRAELTIPTWSIKISLASLGFIGVGFGFGLAVAGGVVEMPIIRGRRLPGLDVWALLGLIPLIGALFAWWCLTIGHRAGMLISTVTASTIFVGTVGAWASQAVDEYKAAKPLTTALKQEVTESEIRIGCYLYYEPSLVFYAQREITRFVSGEEAREFLHYPMPVYLYAPLSFWTTLEPETQKICRVVKQHRDLYHTYEVVLITNR